MMSERTREKFILLALFLLSCCIRFYGIDFGLPHTECRPDETTIINIALTFLDGDLNPHFFNYPTLYMYLLAIVYFIYINVRLLLGHSSLELMAAIQSNPASFLLISRGLSALLGSMTVLVVYGIVKRLADRKTALIAAVFMSVCYLHVRDSHFGTTDVTMVFFTMCAVAYILKCYDNPSKTHYILAGLFSGLATSTKYGGLFLVLPMVVMHIMRRSGLKPGVRTSIFQAEHQTVYKKHFPNILIPVRTFILSSLKQLKHRRFIFYLLSFSLSFLVFTPFALLDFRHFISDFTGEMKHLVFGHLGMNLGRGWFYHTRYTLPYGMGWLLFFSSGLGILVYARKHIERAIVLFLFPLAYYCSAGRGYTVFLRYMIPMLPFLCIAGALFVTTLTDWVSQRRQIKWLPLFIVSLVVAEPIYRTICFDRVISRKDNRIVAARWIREYIPFGSHIHQTGSKYAIVQPHSVYGTADDMEYTHDWTYFYTVLTAEGDDLPDYILVQKSALRGYDPIPQRIVKLIRGEYHFVKNFMACDVTQHNWYDQLDAFYIPFKGFRGVRRPGPNITIYERNDIPRRSRVLDAVQLD